MTRPRFTCGARWSEFTKRGFRKPKVVYLFDLDQLHDPVSFFEIFSNALLHPEDFSGNYSGIVRLRVQLLKF